jgi:hypothetical protein
MSYLEPFLRLVVIGRLYDAEDFSFSFNFGDVENGTPPTEVPDGVMAAIEAFWGVSGMVSQHAEITNVKLNEIGVDGRYRSQTTVERAPLNPVIGGSVSTPPPQVALAFSLLTAQRRGRAHAGRFYLPTPGWSIDNDGRLATFHALEAANQAAIMLNACTAALPGYQPAIVSNVGTGLFHWVTGVRVGRVYDTIRSRRTSLDEDYQTSGITVPEGN